MNGPYQQEDQVMSQEYNNIDGRVICGICDAVANGFHFNAASCSACAAFFRRAVTLDRLFRCPNESNCRVHYSMRVICRACRFNKCLRAGMQKKSVQPRRDRNAPNRRHWRFYQSAASTSLPNEGTSREQQYSPAVPTMPMPSPENPVEELLRLERLYNERRKILYCGNSSISTLLSTCEIDDIPYRDVDLEILTFAAIRKDIRPQILLTYEWIREWKHLGIMSLQDKKMFLRRCILYHTILDPAYLTYQLGYPEKFVMFNGQYVGIPADSQDGWTDEDGIISSTLKTELYRPLMERAIKEIVEPMKQIGLSYTEYVVLKGLVSFKGTSVHELDLRVKEMMSRQIDEILISLNMFYREQGYSDQVIAERTGNMVLLMSSVFAVSLECLESHQKIQFFDLWELDDLILQLISRRAARKVSPPRNTQVPATRQNSLTILSEPPKMQQSPTFSTYSFGFQENLSPSSTVSAKTVKNELQDLPEYVFGQQVPSPTTLVQSYDVDFSLEFSPPGLVMLNQQE